MGPKETGPWYVGKMTLGRKLGMFMTEKLPLEIIVPTFHHSRCEPDKQVSKEFLCSQSGVEFPRH